jgi:hypothetical protein
MAVRNDFTAGEVLAAADLNDTFASKADYPSGGSNGDLLTKSGTSTAWAAPSVAGLTLITAESFSAVSSVSVNNCFSATYDNYLMLIKQAGSGGMTFTMRLRASGTDATAANYATQYLVASSTSTAAAANGSNTSFFLGFSATLKNSFSVYLFDPFVTGTTSFMTGPNKSGSSQLDLGIGDHSLSTSYDGFSLLASAGTITGNVRVYGYRN